MQESSGITSKGILVLAIIFAGLAFTFGYVPQHKRNADLQASVIDSFVFSHSSFEDAVLQADVAYIENLETGQVLYQKKAAEVRPLASLTKIMTTYSALSIFPPDSSITIQESDLAADGDHGLVPGEVWDLEDLLVFMLISSSNDAALAIEREALAYTEGLPFPEYMTKQAHDLGFTSLIFKNASGLDLDEEGTEPSAVGTAEDITKLFSLAYKEYKDIFDATKKSRVTFTSSVKDHTAENTNIALHTMPGIIGSKTGYTNTAGGNLSVVTNINNIPHLITVLDSTRAGRFNDVQEIIDLTAQEL